MTRLNAALLAVIGAIAALALVFGGIATTHASSLEHDLTVAKQAQFDAEQQAQRTASKNETDLDALQASVTKLTGSKTADQVKDLNKDVTTISKDITTIKARLKKICDDKSVSNQISSLQGSATASQGDGTYYYDQVADIIAVCGQDDSGQDSD